MTSNHTPTLPWAVIESNGDKLGRGEILDSYKRLSHERDTLLRQRDELADDLRDIRVFVQDCLDRESDRACMGNLMSARDIIDKALATIAKEKQP